MKKTLAILSLSLVSVSTFAMFCPKGLNQMNFGDTIEQVTQQCGAPDSQNTKKEAPFQPQEWVFYVKPDPKQTGSVKMTVAFDSKKIATNITVNAQSLQKTPLCGTAIQAGQTTDMIKQACGSPAMINQSQLGAGPAAAAEVVTTTFKYSSAPPTTLTFVDGKLSSRN